MFAWLAGLIPRLGDEAGSPDDHSTIVSCERRDTATAWGSYVCNERCIFQPSVRVVAISDVHSRQFTHGFNKMVGNVTDKALFSANSNSNSNSNNSISNSSSPDGGLSFFNQTETCNSLPCGDILIISGDITRCGYLAEIVIFRQFIDELVRKEKYRHIILVAGNHETTFDVQHYNEFGYMFHEQRQDPIKCREAMLESLPPNVHYLEDSFVVIDGIKIYGTPWVRGDEKLTPLSKSSLQQTSTSSSSSSSSSTSAAAATLTEGYRWAFTTEESVLAEKYSNIPNDVDILVTHMPPHGIGDVIRDYNSDSIVDGKQVLAYQHKGSESLTAKVKSINPYLHVFGHYHVGYGAYSSPALCKNTFFVNAAICDEDYFPIQKPFVIDLNIPGYNYKHTSLSSSMSSVSSLLSSSMSAGGVSSTDFGDYDENMFLAGAAIMTAIYNNKTKAGVSEKFLMLNTISKVFLTEVCMLPRAMFKEHEAKIATQSKILYDALNEVQLLEEIHFASKLCAPANIDDSKEFRNFQLILPYLYLGPVYSTQDKQRLSEKGISHICNFSHYPNEFVDEFEYYTVGDVKGRSASVELTSSRENQNVSIYFMEVIAFIDRSIQQGGKVLVYCEMGLSNSAAVVTAYLMFTFKISFEQAFYFVKRARPYLHIKDELIEDLEQFEDSIKAMRSPSF